MHACEMRSQSRIDNVLDLFQIGLVHTRRVYHAGAQVRKHGHLDGSVSVLIVAFLLSVKIKIHPEMRRNPA
jgi:hypothetical protein